MVTDVDLRMNDFVQLFFRGGDDARVGMTGVDDSYPGCKVEECFAARSLNVRSLSAGEDEVGQPTYSPGDVILGGVSKLAHDLGYEI